jgi:glycosyltransferase involved in cell wall biosynthesis
MTKYLARLGHEVTVMTSLMSGSGPVPGATRTIRCRDLHVSPLNWRRGSFRALKGEIGGAYAGSPSAVSAWVIPDLELLGWIPFALPRALRLATSKRFDCVITSSPPQSGHLIGLALRHHGLPWIADLRDGWTFEPGVQRFPPGWRRTVNGRLERAVLSRADVVVGVTQPIADDLHERVNQRAVTITNGFDPDELSNLGAAAAPAAAVPGKYTLAYTGTLSYGGASGASSEPLLDAVRRLRAHDPDGADRLDLVFAGPTSSAEAAQLGSADLRGSVRVLGPLPHAEALCLQRRADALLLIADPQRKSMATGKLYEYLAARRPILVLGEHSVAAQIVAEAGAGIVAPVHDPVAIEAALSRLLRSSDGVRAPDREAIERFSYERLATRMAEQVERAIARKSTGQP